MAQQAKYLDVAASVLARIRDLPPGSRCPGIRQITCEYHIAGATAERVLRHLTEQGHVRQVTGKGTFVAERFVRRIAILPCTAEASAPLRYPDDADDCSCLTRQIANHLERAGHEVHVLPPPTGASPTAGSLAAAAPDLLVTVGISSHRFLEDLACLGKPIICVGFAPLNLLVDFVASATLRSSYMVTRALLEAGLTDAWYVGAEHGWPDASVVSLTHSIGFQAACRDIGIAHIPSRVRLARRDNDLDAIVREFFSQAPPLRALVAADTSIGRRFLAAAGDYAVRVPEDLAIVAASSRESANVSCLAPDPARLAAAAAETIRRRIRQPDLPAQDVRVEPRFVDAGSMPPAAAQCLRRMLMAR